MYKDIYTNTSVIELKYNDFIHRKIQLLNHNDFKNKIGLIVFYAPWCIHCKNMKNDWIELSNLFKHKFILGAVNIEDIKNNNDKLSMMYNINQYPTIKYVTKTGRLMNYNGDSDKEDLMYFICRKDLNCL